MRTICFRFRVHYLHMGKNEGSSVGRFRGRFTGPCMFNYGLVFTLRLCMSPIVIKLPWIVFGNGSSASVFARCINALSIMRVRFKIQVIIRIGRITADVIISTANQVSWAYKIVHFNPLYCFLYLRLSPDFIREGPDSSAKVIVRRISSFFPFLTVINFQLF